MPTPSQMTAIRPAPPLERLMRLPEVLRLTALSRTQIYKRIAGGSFPSPIKLSADRFAPSLWLESEVAVWMHGVAEQWRKERPPAYAPPARPRRGRPRKASTNDT